MKCQAHWKYNLLCAAMCGRMVEFVVPQLAPLPIDRKYWTKETVCVQSTMMKSWMDFTNQLDIKRGTISYNVNIQSNSNKIRYKGGKKMMVCVLEFSPTKWSKLISFLQTSVNRIERTHTHTTHTITHRFLEKCQRKTETEIYCHIVARSV